MFFGGDPFEHFAHMGGGHGGGGGAGRRRSSEPVDNTGFYTLLGVEKNAEEAEIRRNYKKLALKHHPDRGGDPEKFKEIQGAYDVLVDPEKRKIYDQVGKEGLESGDSGGGGGDDILSHFFGGGGRRERGPTKTEDIVHTIKASLEDMYNGKTARLAINRNKPCPDCEGRGGKVGCERDCSDCNGRGIKVSLRQIGPGMVQQMQTTCPGCKGAGKVITERDKCRSCSGSKVYKDKKVLEVNIEKGMKNGQKIKFSGEADETPGSIPGDVVIVLQEKEHDVFKRKGADLVISLNLQLSEALCGFVKTITHLDGRLLKIESPPGTVMPHESVRVIQGEGMPYHGNPFTKGRLFIQFKVIFPKTLPVRAITALDAVLPKPAPPSLSGEEEECNMTEVDLSQFGQADGRSTRDATADDDDEGGGGGAQRVQCGQA